MKDFKLDDSEKLKSGFQIPGGYFDAFSEEVLQRISKEETKVLSFYSRNKRLLYSLAALFMIVLSLPILNHLHNNEQELSYSEIENYLTQNKSVTDYELINLLEIEDIDKIKITTSISKKAIEEELSNNTEIEHFITNEN
jgi:Mlc titration factor MtfA (ptsG expression regulator)